MINPNKITMSRIAESLERWRDDEHHTDYNLMLDKGLILMAAEYIVGAGAIGRSNIDRKDFISIEILRLVGNYTAEQRKADLDAFWAGTTCYVNACGDHWFICPNVNNVFAEELKKLGFEKSE